jgi:predicted DsbA family dithiol-disulfide isomerase
MEAFRAYFQDGKNLARKTILTGIAESAGLSTSEALEVIDNRLFKEEVDKDWALAKELGIQAVPTISINSLRLVGAQPYEKIFDFIRRAGNII